MVVADEAVKKVTRTKEAISLLQALKAYEDVEKVADSKRVRAGRGKSRNRRFSKRRGPLICHLGMSGEQSLKVCFEFSLSLSLSLSFSLILVCLGVS